MPIYRYVKKYPRKKFQPPRFASYLLICMGIVMLLWVAWPIVSFKFISVIGFSRTITPLGSQNGQISPIGDGIVHAASQDQTNYADPNTWFPGKPQKKIVTPINTYSLSIPKLHIENATVVIAGDSLDKSLIHYGGTAIPGEYGNTVIFGHSTLPALYDPKSYKTIFSLLPTLDAASATRPGDDIFITYDEITYRYEVIDIVVTKPQDLSPLEQTFDDSYVTLVTCVPPGTYWERMYVKARIIPLQ